MMSHIRESIRGREEWTVYEQIGFAVSCMLHNRNYSLYPVLTIQYWTEYAIQHNQIKFLFDSRGFPLAYITRRILRQIRKHACSTIRSSDYILLNGMKMEGSGSRISVVSPALAERPLSVYFSFARGGGRSALAEQEEENHDISAHAAT